MLNKSKIVNFVGGAICALGIIAGASYAFADTPVVEDTVAAFQVETPDGDAPLTRPNHGGAGKGNLLGDYIDPEEVKAAAADALGLSVEELEAAREARTSLEELAEQQGVTVEAVNDAVQAVYAEGVANAAADGAITQEQADELLTRLENNPRLGVGRPRHGHRGNRGRIFGILKDYVTREDVQAATASALGISVEELQTMHEDGTRLPEIAEELGVEMEDVEAAVKEVIAAGIADALEDGAITQEQADLMLEKLENHGGFGAPRRGFGPGAAPNTPNQNTNSA